MKKWLLRLSCAVVAMAAMFAVYHTADGDQDATIPMSSNAQYDLNHMTSQASKWRLGYLVNHALNPSGFQQLTSGAILVGNGSNVGTALAPSGDVTMTNAGVFALKPSISVDATGTLTQANIQGMNAAPVTLVATPAAGQVLIPIELELQHVATATTYAAGGTIKLQYPKGSTDVIAMAPAVATEGGSTVYFVRPSAFDLNSSSGTGSGFNVAAVSASALTITNATAAFTAGSVGNVINYRLKYRVITIP